MRWKHIFSINNKWFFTELPPVFKLFSFFVRGDLLVLFPLLVMILLLALFSIKFMMIIVGVYIAVRSLGEMIYWFSHQFYERKYRPYDFGFANLDNHALYIIYQTFAIVGMVVGIGLVIFEVLYK